MIAHLGATGQTGIIDATEIRVRRPAANQPGRSRYVPGKTRMNVMKALVVTDDRGRVLFRGEVRAGSPTSPGPAMPAWSTCSPAPSTRRSSPTPATRAWAHRPAAKWSPCQKRRGKYLEQDQWLMAH
ncbi:hypothetical protein [Kitasatospora sp. NPDC001547]|uniref:hypothetical protein n=1 Tax=Kitasatospora sp. NPDC001547 TaxID=3364015 RepID=UPI0036BC4E61